MMPHQTDLLHFDVLPGLCFDSRLVKISQKVLDAKRYTDAMMHCTLGQSVQMHLTTSAV